MAYFIQKREIVTIAKTPFHEGGSRLSLWAGLLTSESTERFAFPSLETVAYKRSLQLQRRDRNGVTPFSLLSPKRSTQREDIRERSLMPASSPTSIANCAM
jgi:hypothetical protein